MSDGDLPGSGIVICAEIPIDDRNLVRVTREVRGGRWRLRVREFFKSADGEWRPGGKGIDLRREHVAPTVGGMIIGALEDAS